MDRPNAFSDYVKTTLSHVCSISEVDLSHLKRETSEHGSSLMEVDCRGNIDPQLHIKWMHAHAS